MPFGIYCGMDKNIHVANSNPGETQTFSSQESVVGSCSALEVLVESPYDTMVDSLHFSCNLQTPRTLLFTDGSNRGKLIPQTYSGDTTTYLYHFRDQKKNIGALVTEKKTSTFSHNSNFSYIFKSRSQIRVHPDNGLSHKKYADMNAPPIDLNSFFGIDDLDHASTEPKTVEKCLDNYNEWKEISTTSLMIGITMAGVYLLSDYILNTHQISTGGGSLDYVFAKYGSIVCAVMSPILTVDAYYERYKSYQELRKAQGEVIVPLQERLLGYVTAVGNSARDFVTQPIRALVTSYRAYKAQQELVHAPLESNKEPSHIGPIYATFSGNLVSHVSSYQLILPPTQYFVPHSHKQ